MTGRWFSPGTSDSSTNKTDSHDITEILLKVALSTINHKPDGLVGSKNPCEATCLSVYCCFSKLTQLRFVNGANFGRSWFSMSHLFI